MPKCAKVTCREVNAEPIYACSGGCDGLFHPKCMGITASVAEKMKTTPGLAWYCQSCRKTSSAAIQLSILKIGQKINSVNYGLNKGSALTSRHVTLAHLGMIYYEVRNEKRKKQIKNLKSQSEKNSVRKFE